uniref:Uncharacterized protein n=1 Tax=Alexandrium monilatum TaxID=311494 RepID=A0A7S4QHW6_9DINO
MAQGTASLVAAWMGVASLPPEIPVPSASLRTVRAPAASMPDIVAKPKRRGRRPVRRAEVRVAEEEHPEPEPEDEEQVPVPVMKRRHSRKGKTIIARGRLAKVHVFRGYKEKTSGGLTADRIGKNARGRLVSKAASAASKVRFAKGLCVWNQAVSDARKLLRLEGFVAINGGTPMGKALYAKARSLFSQRSAAIAVSQES